LGYRNNPSAAQSSPTQLWGNLDSVSCRDASHCAAVGNSGIPDTFAEDFSAALAATYVDGQWSSLNENVSGYVANKKPALDAGFYSVACTTQTSCVAILDTSQQYLLAMAPVETFLAEITPVESRSLPSPPTDLTISFFRKIPVIDWSPPTSDNGSPIASSTGTARTGHELPIRCKSAYTARKLSGLIKGRTYLIDVTATNAVGTSRASKVSTYKVPKAAPSKKKH
jgi:hypothetical protein